MHGQPDHILRVVTHQPRLQCIPPAERLDDFESHAPGLQPDGLVHVRGPSRHQHCKTILSLQVSPPPLNSRCLTTASLPNSLAHPQTDTASPYTATCILVNHIVLRLHLTVCRSASPHSSFPAKVRLVVGTYPLFAALDGGDAMSTSASKAIVLDASVSYDPNLAPPARQTDQGLHFKWTCMDQALSLPCTDAGGAPLTIAEERVVILAAGLF